LVGRRSGFGECEAMEMEKCYVVFIYYFVPYDHAF